MRRIFLLPLGVVLCLVALFAIVYTVGAFQFAPQTNSSFTNTSVPQTGKVGDTLVTPERVHITLLGVEQHGTQLLFHLGVHNTQGQPVRVWNLDADHGFALYNKVTDTFVITAGAPADAATHPALAQTVNGQGSVSGWIAFAVPLLSQYSTTFFYRFRTVHTLRCGSAKTAPPSDPSKCQPADLYSTVSWDF